MESLGVVVDPRTQTLKQLKRKALKPLPKARRIREGR